MRAEHGAPLLTVGDAKHQPGGSFAQLIVGTMIVCSADCWHDDRLLS
jgi:hypothetical protein